MQSASEEEEDRIASKPRSKSSATPRRASAVKRPANATPVRRKASPAVKNPNSAPARTKNGGKKVESTLLGDFLLGRPSPSRTGRGGSQARPSARRRSFDAAAVKRELKLQEDAVGKVPQQGGVKDKVKQWQETSVATAVVVPANEQGEPDEAANRVEEASEGEDDSLRIKMRDGKRPGRRKLSEEGNERRKDDDGESHERTKSTPKKRVISDDHWMKKKKSPTRKMVTIPKDFLKPAEPNPPLEWKMQDWVQRTQSDKIVVEVEEGEERRSKRSSGKDGPNETPNGRRVSRKADLEVTPTNKRVSHGSKSASKQESLDEGIQKRPSKSNPSDLTRIKPSPDHSLDGEIRLQPSQEKSGHVDHGTRIRLIRKEGSKRVSKDGATEENASPRKPSEHHPRPSHSDRIGNANHGGPNVDDDAFSVIIPSRSQKAKRRDRKSEASESMDEIPFGNSAFSVLDLPVGAEAGTLRRPPPKRNSSFAVPKVFKKIYNEGISIARDTVEPPIVGQSQPPSIESWLNETTDPFVDRPCSHSSNLEIPESSSRRRSYNPDDQSEREFTASFGESKKDPRVRKPQDMEVNFHNVSPREPTPKEIRTARETLPTMRIAPPLSPTRLKRSPATHDTSPPKSARRLPLSDAVLDAFRGESAPVGSKNFLSPLVDVSGGRHSSRPPELDVPVESIASQHAAPKLSPRRQEHSNVDVPIPQRRTTLSAYPRRPAPTTREHRLSTIASVETFSTFPSANGTESVLSHTTLTQATVSTAPTSSLSRNSKGSGKDLGLKRRLTKHSDLVSVLSLPHTGASGQAKSIRSARSVRTTRIRLESATIQDLMRELADDETKYMRELKTLVDGVIPVLLTCVLSKSDSAKAAGLFDPNTNHASDSSLTKPIVDMGIALERLKSLHKRMPLQDPHAFMSWTQAAYKNYEDYLVSWRMGFQDVVVNLAPASRQSSFEQKSNIDEMPRNVDGDVLDTNGERADVQYMLKRPLIRAKYLCKIVKVS